MAGERSWREIRAERIRTPEDERRVETIKAEILAQVRAHRLAEVRKDHGLTQIDVAQAMDVTQGRVSTIEKGDLSRTEISTIRKYVEALGGEVEIVAKFGDVAVRLC